MAGTLCPRGFAERVLVTEPMLTQSWLTRQSCFITAPWVYVMLPESPLQLETGAVAGNNNRDSQGDWLSGNVPVRTKRNFLR